MSSRPRPRCPKCKLATCMIRYTSSGGSWPPTGVHMFCMNKACDFDGFVEFTEEQVTKFLVQEEFYLTDGQKKALMAP